MKYYDIMDKEEKGIFISFVDFNEANNWLSKETEWSPEYVKNEGMHIVENERLTIYEKYKIVKQKRDMLNKSCDDLLDEMLKSDIIEHLAMSIVNYTNEINKVNVDVRQNNNDKCFDFAVGKIKLYMEKYLFKMRKSKEYFKEKI